MKTHKYKGRWHLIPSFGLCLELLASVLRMDVEDATSTTSVDVVKVGLEIQSVLNHKKN